MPAQTESGAVGCQPQDEPLGAEPQSCPDPGGVTLTLAEHEHWAEDSLGPLDICGEISLFTWGPVGTTVVLPRS